LADLTIQIVKESVDDVLVKELAWAVEVSLEVSVGEVHAEEHHQQLRLGFAGGGWRRGTEEGEDVLDELEGGDLGLSYFSHCEVFVDEAKVEEADEGGREGGVGVPKIEFVQQFQLLLQAEFGRLLQFEVQLVVHDRDDDLHVDHLLVVRQFSLKFAVNPQRLLFDHQGALALVFARTALEGCLLQFGNEFKFEDVQLKGLGLELRAAVFKEGLELCSLLGAQG
jgi:hypothetical protein